MIPVSGDLVSAAKRPLQGAPVPIMTPIMNTSRFSGPRGSAPAGNLS